MNRIERDTTHRAVRNVRGFYTVAVRRCVGDPWEVTFCRRTIPPVSPLPQMIWEQVLPAEHFHGRTFETPDAAAAYVRTLLRTSG